MVRAKAGDSHAFEELVDEYTPPVYRVARAMIGESAARDAVQETFLAAWRSLHGLRDPESFAAWLHRICVNECRNLLRRRQRVRELELDPARVRSPSPDLRPDAETRAMLLPLLRSLPDEQRVVIALHYAAGMTISQVADVLGIPTGTAKSRLSAALASLRARLDGALDD